MNKQSIHTHDNRGRLLINGKPPIHSNKNISSLMANLVRTLNITIINDYKPSKGVIASN